MLTTLLSYWRTILFSRKAATSRQGHMLTGAALRDPTDFYQSNSLEAAVMKRRRRAAKLHNNTDRSLYGNPALRNGATNLSHQTFSPAIADRLNPFYVAK